MMTPVRRASLAHDLRHALKKRQTLEMTVAKVPPILGISEAEAEFVLLFMASEYPCDLRVDKKGRLVFAFRDLDQRLPARKPGARIMRFLVDRQELMVMILIFLFGSPLLFLSSSSAFGLMGVAKHYDGALGQFLNMVGMITTLPMGFVAFAAAAILFLSYTWLLGISALVFFLKAGLEPANIFAGVAIFSVFTGGWVFGVRPWEAAGKPVQLQQDAEGVLDAIFGKRLNSGTDFSRIFVLLKRQKGRITTTDIMVTLGVSRQDAHERITGILMHYGGTIDVSNSGVLIFRFPAFEGMKPSADEVPMCVPVAPTFWGRKTGWVQVLIVLTLSLSALTCWLDPALMFLPYGERYMANADFDYIIAQGLGGWPVVFVLALMLVRIPMYFREKKKWAAQKPFVDLLGKAFENPSEVIVKDVNAQMLVALGGTVDEEASDPHTQHWVLRFPVMVDEKILMDAN